MNGAGRVANKRARRGAGRNTRGLNVEFDGVLIDEGSGEGTEKLGDPESVPHADGAKHAAEDPRGGDHDDDVAAQRDDEGLGALPSASSEPEAVTERVDTRKPALMMRKAT